MDPRAINKAKARFRSAQRSLDGMRSAPDFETLSDHWVSFLTAWKSIYTSLEQGAKVTAQSRQWFGSKKQERRNDPLLQYLFQARNDEEHGLDESVDMSLGSMLFELPDEGVEGRQIKVEFDPATGQVVAQRPDGGPIRFIRQRGPGPNLCTVKGRGTEVFGAPIEHSGKVIDGDPIVAAEIGLDLISKLISEAELLTP